MSSKYTRCLLAHEYVLPDKERERLWVLDNAFSTVGQPDQCFRETARTTPHAMKPDHFSSDGFGGCPRFQKAREIEAEAHEHYYAYGYRPET
jgi:hypothetical protein